MSGARVKPSLLLLVLLTGCTLPCLPGFVRLQGQCVPYDTARGLCAKVCEERACGDDGCGGSCGTCSGKTPYCTLGQCVAACTPSCDGLACGDNGCGGSCGKCKDGTTCSPTGKACVPKGFTCDPRYYADGFACDCGCGVADPDCDNPALPVHGCTTRGATCDATSTCTGGGTWTCAELNYQDGHLCDCGCGVPDPDCKLAGAPVHGCARGEVCSSAGTCTAGDCSPNCAGKTCGDDGCGGSCGDCSAPTPYCNSGVCGATCTPNCTDKTCGSNGCGGSCGTCTGGQQCQSGACVDLPVPLSCAGHCGTDATSGCSCAASCIDAGNCCGDAEAKCGCFAKCTNKSCGDDGCGGSCGTCDSGKRCGAGQCVTDLCSPDPCNGHGTCAQGTGQCTCADGYAGTACNACDGSHTGYPTCAPSKCGAYSCNGHGACDPATGNCTCDMGYTGAACNACTGAGVFPACP
jgi:hypothetical protein